VAEERLDVIFADETRPRALRVVGGAGIVLSDGDKALFNSGARPLIAAILTVAGEGKGSFGDWCKKVRAGMPSSG